jgi:outer membrane protein
MHRIAVALLVASGAAAQQTALTLPEAVRIAVAKHPDVQKARASADILKGRITEVRSQALPDVSFNANALRMRDPSLLNASGIENFPQELRDALIPRGVNLFDYSINVKQPIYTAGKVGTALRLASIEAEGALADIDRAEQDLALEVVKAFYGLLWAERSLKLVEETQRQREVHAAMARTRFQNGVATEVDALRSEVAVANGGPEVVRARNAVQQARARINYYLARSMDSPVALSGDFEEVAWDVWDLDELTREAIRRRPELNRLRVAERSAATQLDLARAESRMRMDFVGGYGVMSRLTGNLFNSQFTRWNVALNFTLPVFDGFRRSGLVQQATAAERQARLERERVEQQVRLGIQQGLDELAAAKQTISAARANVGQAERVLEMMQNNYKWGAATTLDILDAQTALSTARGNLLRGLYDYVLARANLRWMLGRTPWE